METPALDGIRNTAEVFDKLQAPAGTSCALQAAFLYRVLIQHEAMKEQRTSSRSHVPIALAATVNSAAHQSLSPHAQDCESRDIISAYDDHNSDHYASDNASTFDMNLVDGDSWAFVFANAGFNIDQGAFMSPTCM